MNTENNMDETGSNQESSNNQSGASNDQVVISKSLVTKIGASFGALLIGALGIFFVMSTMSDSRLTKAVELCEVDGASGIVFAEDGQTLNFDGKGDEDFIGADYSDLICLLEETVAPSTVLDSMNRTSSLMGVQDAEWDGISVSWSYHPNRGLDASFEIIK